MSQIAYMGRIVTLLSLAALLGLVLPAAAQSSDEADQSPAVDDQPGASAESASKKDSADEAAEDAEDAEDESKLKINGTFAAVEEHQIRLRPQQWKEFKVKRAVPHGGDVRAGDVLIEFEKDGYQRKLDTLEEELKLTEIALEQSEAKLRRLRKTVPMDIAAAARKEQVASEDLRRFLTVGREARIKNERFSFKRAQDYLAYEQEELKQLLKMYSEDDLTEETEEIILRRTKDDVESRRFFHDNTQRELDEALEVKIPRLEARLEESVRRAAVELERVRAELPATLRKEELNSAQQATKLKQQRRQLADFRADADWLVIKSPISGVAIYGEHNQGKWNDPADLHGKLSPGGTCKIEIVLMTVVRERPLKVLSRVEEKDLRHVRQGSSCVMESVAIPNATFTGQVTGLDRYPTGPTHYEMEVSVAVPDDLAIVPGMSCKLVFEKNIPSEEDHAE